jgi:hypothetical protein
LLRLLSHTYNLPTEQASDFDERRMRALQAIHRLRCRRGSKVNSLNVCFVLRGIFGEIDCPLAGPLFLICRLSLRRFYMDNATAAPESETTVCVALLWCDTETQVCKTSHIDGLNMQLAAVLLHHHVPADCFDCAAASAVHDAQSTWSVMTPVHPNEFLSLPAVEHAIRQAGSIQISRQKECIVLSGRSLHALLKVTACSLRNARKLTHPIMRLNVDNTIARGSKLRANLFVCKCSFPSTVL